MKRMCSYDVLSNLVGRQKCSQLQKVESAAVIARGKTQYLFNNGDKCAQSLSLRAFIGLFLVVHVTNEKMVAKRMKKRVRRKEVQTLDPFSHPHSWPQHVVSANVGLYVSKVTGIVSYCLTIQQELLMKCTYTEQKYKRNTVNTIGVFLSNSVSKFV